MTEYSVQFTVSGDHQSPMDAAMRFIEDVLDIAGDGCLEVIVSHDRGDGVLECTPITVGANFSSIILRGNGLAVGANLSQNEHNAGTCLRVRPIDNPI